MLKVEMRTLAAMLAASLAGAGGVGAQQISSPYRFVETKQDLGVSVGHIFADRGTANLGPDGGLAFAIEYTRRVSRPLSLTPVLLYFPTTRLVIDPSVADGSQEADTVGTEDLDILLVAGRVNLNLTGTRTWHNLVPYVFGGLGIAFELTGATDCVAEPGSPDCQIEARERFDFSTSFTLQFGVGTVWLPSQRWGVRLEFLNSIWRLKTPPGYIDPGVTLGVIPQPTDWTNNLQINLTLGRWF